MTAERNSRLRAWSRLLCVPRNYAHSPRTDAQPQEEEGTHRRARELELADRPTMTTPHILIAYFDF